MHLFLKKRKIYLEKQSSLRHVHYYRSLTAELLVLIKAARLVILGLNTRAESPTSKWKPSFADTLALINMY